MAEAGLFLMRDWVETLERVEPKVTGFASGHATKLKFRAR
jgi:hypothetical protein